MARPSQEAIDTFISITGADEAVAARKLEVKPTRSSPLIALPAPSAALALSPVEIAPGLRACGVGRVRLELGFRSVPPCSAPGPDGDAMRWRMGGGCV
jgi:hypothetical protein